jgi:hypothetical protein
MRGKCLEFNVNHRNIRDSDFGDYMLRLLSHNLAQVQRKSYRQKDTKLSPMIINQNKTTEMRHTTSIFEE